MIFHAKLSWVQSHCVFISKKIDGFVYDGISYLVLNASKIENAIYTSIRYLISEKKQITDSINHKFARSRIDSQNSLLIEKALAFHLIILIKSVVNKNKNDYCHNILLEKGSYEVNQIRNIFK